MDPATSDYDDSADRKKEILLAPGVLSDEEKREWPQRLGDVSKVYAFQSATESQASGKYSMAATFCISSPKVCFAFMSHGTNLKLMMCTMTNDSIWKLCILQYCLPNTRNLLSSLFTGVSRNNRVAALPPEPKDPEEIFHTQYSLGSLEWTWIKRFRT